jgi:hypothetical protein
LLRVNLGNDQGAPPVGSPFMLSYDYRYGVVYDGCVFRGPFKQCRSCQRGRVGKYGPEFAWNLNFYRVEWSLGDFGPTVLWIHIEM